MELFPADPEDFRTIWLKADDDAVVQVIDQRWLPHKIRVFNITRWQDGVEAIAEMVVRGAPLIGATAAWSLYLAARPDASAGSSVREAADTLAAARPTAVNLRWAIERMLSVVDHYDGTDLAGRLRNEAERICSEDIEICRAIGTHGLSLLQDIARKKSGGRVNVLTHCNAGSLATINWGTATAPVYLAQRAGIDVHVWVDETRPRNQGSQLTAFELAANDVPHTLIVDNAGGHLMQHGAVDIVITGTDRTTRCGDVANKIGTYLKALAAHDNGIPFYVALPSTTIDWTARDGIAEIPIEERNGDEVAQVYGMTSNGPGQVRTTAASTSISNPAFDVTPARLVTGLITERGIAAASESDLLSLFPEQH